MSGKHSSRDIDHQRLQTAELAARFIREGGLSLGRAREKAAARLGINSHPGSAALPSDGQIQQALETQLSLFSPPARDQLLADKRRSALEAMDFLRHFHPRLAGSVLDGTAQMADPVIVHLHPDAPEDVAIFMEEHQLPARLRSACILLADGRLTVPCWHLVVDETDFQLWVLPAHALQQAPLQSASEPTPMPRANVSQLRALMAR